MDSPSAKSMTSKKKLPTTRTSSLRNGTITVEQTTKPNSKLGGKPKRKPKSTTHCVLQTKSAIVGLLFGSDTLTFMLDDGRTLSAPYFWYPFLAAATDEQRSDYTIEGTDTVWWNAIDDGITIDAFIQGKPDVSRHAVEWRMNRGYAWLDAWVEQRMTDEERNTRNEQLAFLRAAYGVPKTPPNLYEQRSEDRLLTAAELLTELEHQRVKISKQRLHQLTRGFRQKKGGKTYTIAPVLEKGHDWLELDGKVRYTTNGIAHIIRQSAHRL